jgi:hypothetical protein
MLTKNLRNFLIGVLYIIPMFLAHSVGASEHSTFAPPAISHVTVAELISQGNAGDGLVKDRNITQLVSLIAVNDTRDAATLAQIRKDAIAAVKEVALKWAETSDRARTIVLEGIFETRYGLQIYQAQALPLLEKYALAGNGKAFEIMRTKIAMPSVKEIAKKSDVIAAADAHHIDSAVGGWSAFLKAHRLI